MKGKTRRVAGACGREFANLPTDSGSSDRKRSQTSLVPNDAGARHLALLEKRKSAITSLASPAPWFRRASVPAWPALHPRAS